MKIPPARLLCVLLVVVFGLLNSRCTNRNEVRIVGKNFSDEVENLQNLVFTFNQNVWPETLLDQWDTTRFVVFEPEIAGKFRWAAPNELVFSPATAMKAATDYQARLTDKVLMHAEGSRKLKISGKRESFHTPHLKLVNVRSWWVLSPESGRPEPRVRMEFNYPVDRSSVKERLRVKVGDTDGDYRWLPSQATGTVLLALNNGGAEENKLTIILDKGVALEGESHVTQTPVTEEIRLPSSLTMSVLDVVSGFEGNKGYMLVYTSQDVVPDQIANSLKLQPEIPFTVESVDGGFVVKADFLESETYVLELQKTLKGTLGATLDQEVSHDFFFGKMPESIQFVNRKALYLSTKGSRNVGVQLTNVPTVQVRISKIYDNNLLFYLYNRRYENYSDIDGMWQSDGTYSFSDDYGGQYSDVVVDKKVNTKDFPEKDGIKALNLAIPETHGEARKGVYLVSVASSEAMYLSAQKLVSISDIGLIVKQGKDEVWVFANSIYDTKPLKNVQIKLISSNNQEMYQMVTDGKGVAHVSGLSEKAPGFRLAMVTAALADDFNYLGIVDSGVETSRFEVGGNRSNPTGVQAYVYGERDVYRPGETLNFVSVVRDEQWKTLSEFPVKLRLITPNGQTYGSWMKETDKQGAVATAVKVEEASLTGVYTLELYNGNDVLLTSTSVNVEEFVPDRIKVELSGGKSRYQSGENVTLTAAATNLFGPPAAGRTFEMESQLTRKRFRPKGFPDYIFEIPAEASFERIKKQGVTNQEGKAVGEFSLSAAYKDIGMLEGKVFVTVFDETGRPVNRIHTFEVATQPSFFGVRMPDRYVGVNAPVQAEILSVDPSGKIKTGETAEVEVVRVSYQTVIEKKHGRMQYTSKRKDEIVYRNTLRLPVGKGSFRYTPTVSGEYEIRIRRPGAERYTSLTYYAYGYGFTQYSSFEVSTEGRVLIEMDKKEYRPGDRAKVLFKAPFDGKLLVTIEQGEVVHHQELTTKNRAAEMQLPIAKSYLPNVYVTATLIRPMGTDETIPLTVAHGFEPLTVISDDRKLAMQVTAPSVSRSKTKQTIRVKTAPKARVSIAVVDEGILQIRNFATPDIYGHFYQKRALEVQTSDLYAWLFPELSINRRSSSGGDGFSLERRINPLGNGNRELVRFWSGLLESDAKGEVSYEIELPQFSGALRVMAVAFKDEAFGAASHEIQVADPVVISAGIPRFLSPGDEVVVPVTITNTQQRTTEGEVSVVVNGGLKLIGKGRERLTMPAGQERRFLVRLKASEQIGKGNVRVETKALGEKFVQEYDLNVRPASPLLKVANAGKIKGGETIQLNLNQGFIPGTAAAQLVVSRSPLVEGGGKALSFLVQYPHGCLEQAVSKAFPQLYFGDLVKSMAADVPFVGRGESDFNPAFNVQQTIRKAESQQLFNGGFAMWPGAVRDDWWVSAYTLQFLDEARRAGFDINPSVLSAAVRYLTNRSERKETKATAVRNEDGSRGAPEMAPVEAIYSLYVLAATGNPNRSMMNYYKQHDQLLTNEARYLLAGAYHYIGDPQSYRSLLPTQYEADSRFENYGYGSRLSGLGLVLNLLIDTDPHNLQIPVLARQLSAAIKSGNALSTQEAVFAVLALGKVAKGTAASSVTAEVSRSGAILGRYEGTNELMLTEKLLEGEVTVKTQGTGSLYWFSETSGFEASGIYTEGDEGLRVRRDYLDRYGKRMTSFRQNDLVIAKITLASTNRITVPNVVVTDLLPAGFEVENPRLTVSREMPWIKNASNPDYFDIRDDRIHYFVTATPKEKTFYYQVRVTSVGTFNVGPVAADAMYQTHVKSYSGGRKIEVK